MTSNLGAKDILNTTSKLGFGSSDNSSDKDEHQQIKERVMQKVKEAFKPEFLNRIDEIIVFDRLTEADIEKIAKILLNGLKQRLKKNGISAEFTDGAVSKIAKEGFDAIYGARPLRRAIQSKIEDVLSEMIIDKSIGNEVTISEEDNEFVIK